MKQQQHLKLQAWVDGELSESEARRLAVSVAEDPAAEALVSELRGLKTAMRGAEMACAVPDSREFFWSKIQRQIEREARQAPVPEPAPWLRLWQRIALPLAGLAAAACVVLVVVKPSHPAIALASPGDEVTATSDTMDTMTYHDQSTGLTIVWLQDNSATAPAGAASVDDDNSVDTD
jgi:anti-sigma factor RsiW